MWQRTRAGRSSPAKRGSYCLELNPVFKLYAWKEDKKECSSSPPSVSQGISMSSLVYSGKELLPRAEMLAQTLRVSSHDIWVQRRTCFRASRCSSFPSTNKGAMHVEDDRPSLHASLFFSTGALAQPWRYGELRARLVNPPVSRIVHS